MRLYYFSIEARNVISVCLSRSMLRRGGMDFEACTMSQARLPRNSQRRYHKLAPVRSRIAPQVANYFLHSILRKYYVVKIKTCSCYPRCKDMRLFIIDWLLFSRSDRIMSKAWTSKIKFYFMLHNLFANFFKTIFIVIERLFIKRTIEMG